MRYQAFTNNVDYEQCRQIILSNKSNTTTRGWKTSSRRLLLRIAGPVTRHYIEITALCQFAYIDCNSYMRIYMLRLMGFNSMLIRLNLYVLDVLQVLIIPASHSVATACLWLIQSFTLGILCSMTCLISWIFI